MFSAAPMMPMTFNGNFNSAMAFMAPRTAQPPHLSNFISSILSDGLMEMPPESKVRALPTKAIGEW